MQQNIPIRISVQRVISYPFDYLSNELRIIWVLEGSLQVKFVSGIIELHTNDAEIVNINIPVGLQATDKNLVAIFSIDSEFAKRHFGTIDNCFAVFFRKSRAGRTDRKELCAAALSGGTFQQRNEYAAEHAKCRTAFFPF